MRSQEDGNPVLKRDRVNNLERPMSRRQLLRNGAIIAGSMSLTAGLLAACGGDDDDDSDSDTGGGAAQPTSTPAAEASGATEATDTPQESEDAGGGPKSGGTFVYALSQSPETIDPEVTTYAVTNKININVFDPFIWQAPDFSYVPGVAESWEVSADGMEFTFKLREDVTFHDDTPLNAEAAKFSWDRIMNPDTQSKTAKGQMGPFSEATVVDEFTVKATFEEPFAPFLDGVSQSYTAPVSPTAVEKYGIDFAHNLAGAGPYKLKEWVEGDHITLERYDAYDWAPSIFDHEGPGYLDEIVFKIIIEGVTRVGTLQSGESDGIDSVPAKDVSTFRDDEDTYQVLVEPAPGIPSLLALNTERFPTYDIAVRKALNYAIDKETLIDTLYFGLYTPGYGPITAATLGFDPDIESMYPYDPEMAKQTLEEGGWTLGSDGVYEKDGERHALDYYASSTDIDAPLIQAQWGEVGIEANITQMDYNAVIPIATKGDHNIASIGWIQADPDVARILLYSENIDSGYGWTRFRSDELDNLLEEAASTVDPEERKPLYGEIQQITMENALIVPVRDLYAIYALRSKVKNFRVDTRGWYPWLYDVYLEE